MHGGMNEWINKVCIYATEYWSHARIRLQRLWMQEWLVYFNNVKLTSTQKNWQKAQEFQIIKISKQLGKCDCFHIPLVSQDERILWKPFAISVLSHSTQDPLRKWQPLYSFLNQGLKNPPPLSSKRGAFQFPFAVQMLLKVTVENINSDSVTFFC